MLVGGYPPPWGGILVHIKRLLEYCNSNNIECFVLDTLHIKKIEYPHSNIINLRNIYKIFSRRKNVDIVHIHVSQLKKNYKILFLVNFFSNCKIILTIHSGNFSNFPISFSSMQIRIIKKILNSVNMIITVNNEQKETILSKWPHLENRIRTIPAFIFPTEDGSKVQDDFEKFRNKVQPKQIITISGYLTELYGYDMIIDFLENNKIYAGIFIFYSTPNSMYKEKIIKRITNLENSIYFEDLHAETFNWLLKKSSIYVRNTSTDGDSVAIREAIYWDTIVLASNSVNRPEGVQLFSYNNLTEFLQIFSKSISEDLNYRDLYKENYAQRILNLYYETLLP